jgi:CDP-diacylglycerol---serine O-phosphatidyltransferase
MFLLRHLPNALTCCNLLCGVLGILFIEQVEPIWFLAIACVFDFLDGFAARLFKVNSPIGKELDSLADMITFGVLPSVYWYHLIADETLRYVALLIAVFSALRLAKFNVDERQVEGFIGVPTPANALFLVTFPFLFHAHMVMPAIAIPVILLFCWLMVSPFNMFALKFKTFQWAGNELRFTFLVAAVLLIGIFQVPGVALAIILYILASLVSNSVRAKKM